MNKKILIIRPGAIGDTLMLLPSIKVLLKAAYQVYVAGRRPGIEFLAPYIRGCFDMDDSMWSMLFLSPPSQNRLPPEELDIVICFLKDPDGTVKRNLLYYYPGAQIFVFPSLPPKDAKVHVAEYVATCLAHAPIPIVPKEPFRLATQKAILNGTCPSYSRQYLILHPGSGSKEKNYLPSFWIDLINNITPTLRDSSLRGVVLIGPAEQDIKQHFNQVISSSLWEIQDCPPPSNLLALMRNAMVYVGHDSGVTHLAAMAGAHTIALFKNTDPVAWRPLGPKVEIIRGVKEENHLFWDTAKEVRRLIPRSRSLVVDRHSKSS